MSTDPPTTRLVGRYALYQAIASGGMATVFLGRLLGPVGFARTVAIKRLHAQYASDPQFVTMFLDEARIAARVRHPNVVPTLDVVATDGELFLVMEYVHGESLGRLLRAAVEQGTTLPVPIVVAILSGVLQGLHAAHEAKSERGAPLRIIHRDVSPQNILLGRDGTARILDFGVARAEERLHTTQEGLVKGKLAYMAPEQVRGEAIGPPTDVYAAAAVMWEALTGRALFRGTGERGMVVEVLEAKITPPSEALRAAGNEARAEEVVPLDDVLMRAFARKKEDRWPTAREMARELEAAVSPATASQVSDWVESAAGVALRDRASLVAEIESSSAVELTHDDVGVAMARTSRRDERARGDEALAVPTSEGRSWVTTIPERSAPTVPMPGATIAAEPGEPAADATAPPASEHAPPTTADPQPETIPQDTAKNGRDPIPLGERVDMQMTPSIDAAIEAAIAPTQPDGPDVAAEEPALRVHRPLPGTLVSAPSPIAGNGKRPRLAETLQSKGGFGEELRAAQAKESSKVTADAREQDVPPPPASEPDAPPKRKRTPMVLLALVLVSVGALGAAYAYRQSHGADRAAKPVDRSGLPAPTRPLRDALDPTEPAAKPGEK